MVTIIHCTVPVAEFALAETFQTVPETTVVCEHVAACMSNTRKALIWIKTTEPQAVDDALVHDPTVVTADRFINSGEEWLYQIKWAQPVQVVLQLLTPANATILDAGGSANGWQFRIYYPDRDALRTTYECCKEHSVSIDIHTIHTSDGDIPTPSGPAGSLTEAQYEALTHAYNSGYFTIPRTIDLEELAEELNISHQALSERLRRAHQTLIETTLCQHGLSHMLAPTETSIVDNK